MIAFLIVKLVTAMIIIKEMILIFFIKIQSIIILEILL